MNDYKPNSNRFKEEQKNAQPEKRAEKVITGKVITRKKSAFSKIADEFISDEAKNIKSYVFGEVIIPAAKKVISDIVTDVVDMVLYGGSRGGRKRSTADRVSYRNYYDEPRSNRTATEPKYSFDEVVVSTRGEAQDVLSRMDELMDTYGLVRVADLYDLVGKSCDWTANKYGWTNIRNADIIRVRDGYLIKMPRAVPID